MDVKIEEYSSFITYAVSVVHTPGALIPFRFPASGFESDATAGESKN